MKVEHKTLSLHFVAPFPLLDFLFRFSIIFFFCFCVQLVAFFLPFCILFARRYQCSNQKF